MRKQQGPMLTAHFSHQKKQADKQDPEIQKAWFEAMKKVFEEINQNFDLIPVGTPFSFLDVGCCPGGFSSYILSTFPQVHGTGVSLPVERGGHALLLEEEIKPRFDLLWADLTFLHLGNAQNFEPSFAPFPFGISHPGFELVILDGHPLRTAGPDVHILGDRLLISSLIFGLWCVQRGGTIVMKLSMPDRKISAQILYMLDILSGDLRTWKPVHIHATRSTFYAVARNFGNGPQASRYHGILTSLKSLWDELMLGSSEKPGKDRRLLDHDLDFIVNNRGLEQYSERLKALSTHLWMVEAASLAQWHEARSGGF
ncbi:hypothetical protein V5O48_004416 [Marasmius crinis-equi]|uniref:Ribosomal RNA methyltransferase FtsJ domain-containing protein n=1 Tax=Marasmius crinis-equi TaxID=585013 RepID=A0ABR3FQ90_9AGAR